MSIKSSGSENVVINDGIAQKAKFTSKSRPGRWEKHGMIGHFVFCPHIPSYLFTLAI